MHRIGNGAARAMAPRVPGFTIGRVELRPLKEPGKGYWLLARRSVTKPGELAYYVCFGLEPPWRNLAPAGPSRNAQRPGGAGRKCASGTAGAGTLPRPFPRHQAAQGGSGKKGAPRRGGRADTDDGARGAPIALPAVWTPSLPVDQTPTWPEPSVVAASNFWHRANLSTISEIAETIIRGGVIMSLPIPGHQPGAIRPDSADVGVGPTPDQAPHRGRMTFSAACCTKAGASGECCPRTSPIGALVTSISGNGASGLAQVRIPFWNKS